MCNKCKRLKRENEQLRNDLAAYEAASKLQSLQHRKMVADPIMAAQTFAGIQQKLIRNGMEVRT